MRRFHPICFSLLLVLGALFAQERAHASCSASVTSLNFGNINPISAGAVDVSATVNYNCSSLISLLSYMNVCIEIGLGPQDTAVDNRVMTHATVTSDKLSYNVYSDAARTTVFGNAYGSASPPVIIKHGPYALGLLARATGSQTVYGRVAANNPFMQRNVGPYASSLLVTVRMSLVGLADLSPCIDLAPANVPMPVSAQLISACKITAAPLNFGSHPSNFSANIPGTSTITSSCTKGTPYQIGLNNGLYASGNQRRMKAADGQYINYELYKDASRSQRWGNTLNADTLTGTASGVNQNSSVYGQVMPQTGLEAADYRDTITATITY